MAGPARRRSAPAELSAEALRGLDDLDARLPPSGVRARPAFEKPARGVPAGPPDRLSPEAAAGGGLIEGADGTQRPHYWGHRERLRTRFLTGGHAAMPDYELLELLLFNAIPKIDVKPLAKRLLAEFGDLTGVIAASEYRVLQVSGADRWVFLQLRLAEAFGHRMAQVKVMNREVVSSWEALIAYCRTAMAHRDIEQFRILFLDQKNCLIADETQAMGTVDHVPVYPREVAKRALELAASAVILVHNHPSGDPTPSEADVDMTQRIMDACSAIEVSLYDHVVIGKTGETSFRTRGLI
ncbi:JAB domain-containing protein (plasmid) [Paroceanicella profunda]|uniref:JAB domain-containing protein n=1 Tax=Paroceanicella profunda TaxID=2579971 RepID=A0A5B8G698_9RHOB|nr:DNA repair protein RadC [Paroceanicella profunda]QDL94962.1 JAB domain-containing protein [Paroceanicella profunda]